MKNICKKFNLLQKKNGISTPFKINMKLFHNLIQSTNTSKLPSDSIFIDCRPETQFKESHIKGAVNIHSVFTYLAESSKEGEEKLKNTFQDLLQSKGINGKENLVFYENNLASLKGVSCRGYYLLNLFGYDNNKIHILNDGFDGWKNTNPNLIESGNEEARQKGTFQIKFNKNLYIDYLGLNEIISNKSSNTLLIDVRDLEEWKGDSSSPYGPNFTPRKGRIPGAKHVLWTDLIKEDGSNFKSPEEIQKILEKVGLKDKNQDVIVYCFKGCRSSNSLVALKNAGFKNVKNYLGSWNEWSRNMSLSIDDKKI